MIIFLGCPNYPGSNLFCKDHKDHISPIIHHKQLQKESLAALNKDKIDQMYETEKDGIFLIEEIVKKRSNKKKDEYLIKWEGYTTMTWELASTVPLFLRQRFNKTGLGTIPKPKIRSSKVCGELFSGVSLHIKVFILFNIRSLL